MKEYRCPLCNSTIDLQTYTHIHNIDKSNQQKTKAAIAIAVKQAITKSNKEHDDQVKSLMDTIAELTAKKELSEEHTTANKKGIQVERDLTEILKGMFPDDDIDHTGKGGNDILAFPKNSQSKQIGIISIESKRKSPKGLITKDDIKDAVKGKIKYKADYTFLVTNVVKPNKYFNGSCSYDKLNGIYICSFDVIIAQYFMAHESLLLISQYKHSPEERETKLQMIKEYIESGVFQKLTSTVQSGCNKIIQNINNDIYYHISNWKEQFQIISTIHKSNMENDNNIRLILQGTKPNDKLTTSESSLDIIKLPELPARPRLLNQGANNASN